MTTRAILPVVGLALSLLGAGCYMPVTQHVSSITPRALAVREGQPAVLEGARGSIVTFARIRIVGDTLYGWVFEDLQLHPDSVAVPLRRVLTISNNSSTSRKRLGASLGLG